MTFLQPYILWALPLVLIPVIIHLINRLRHRPQQWAAMRFLLTATQSSVSQAKLRQLLILLFRVLAVTALIFFVARPLAGGWLGWALSPAPEVVLLLLDRSASMETTLPGTTTSRRQQAVKLWADAGRQFQGASRFVLIDSASGEPQEMASLSFLAQSKQASATDTSSDMPGLVQRAFTYLQDNKSGAAEIWIASDLQASNWRLQDSRWEKLLAQFLALPQKARFRLLTFEGTDTANNSISIAELSRRIRNAQAELSVALDIERTGSSPETLRLASSINGNKSEKEVNISGNSFRWRQSFPLPDSGRVGWGTFEIPADSNSRDNTVFFVFGEDLPLRSSVFSSDAPSTRFFALASGEMSESGVARAKVVAPDEARTDDWSTNALIVWQAPLPADATATRLEQFAQEGGVVIFFPSSLPGTNNFAGISWGDISQAAPNQKFAIRQWNELDGPLARTEEGITLPVQSVEFGKRASIVGAQNVLATFADGLPCLVRKNIGKGEIYFCASLPQPDWSSLGEGQVFVPMMQRLLKTGSRRLNRANFVECGTPGPEARSWTRVDASTGTPFETAGIYKAGNRLVAVNRPSEENDLQTASVADVRKLFGDLPLRLHEEKAGGSDRLQGEIWRFFVLAMLLFLLAEGFLILPSRGEEHPEAAPSQAPRKEAVTAA
jgi:hypothetical protein